VGAVLCGFCVAAVLCGCCVAAVLCGCCVAAMPSVVLNSDAFSSNYKRHSCGSFVVAVVVVDEVTVSLGCDIINLN
jgi:hypothetical protein